MEGQNAPPRFRFPLELLRSEEGMGRLQQVLEEYAEAPEEPEQ